MAQETPLFPEAVGLETLNTCNARCVFCPLFQGEHQLDRKIRPAKVLEQEVFETYLSEIANWPVQPHTLFLNMDGEPFQDPLFCDRMTVLKKYNLGKILTLQSNGQLLDEEKALAILDAGVESVVFGFEGATKAVYEAHRVRCTYERVLENIRMFVSLRDRMESPTRVHIKYVRTKRNAHEVRATYILFNAFLDPRKDQFMDIPAIDWSDAQTSQPDLYYSPKVMEGEPSRRCGSLEKHMIVTVNDVMAACCFEYNLDVSQGGYPLRNSTLLDTWRNEKREALRQTLASGDRSLMPLKCRNCPALFNYKLTEKFVAAVPEAYLSESEMGFLYRMGVNVA